MSNYSIDQKFGILNGFINQSNPPINVVSLASDLGIKVYGAPWPDNVSGKIQKDKDRGGDSGFAIYVNIGHPKVRQRFTIAHEIAHYILHEDIIGDGIFDDALYRSGLSDTVEIQANNLAADILMPRSVLIERYHIDPELDSLARYFDVSKIALSVRLKTVLGIVT